MVSDLQFFISVTNAIQRQVLPVMKKQNVMLVPYPFEKVKKSLPLYCYFEVYNLQTFGINNDYELTYKVYSTKGKLASSSRKQLTTIHLKN